MKAKISTERVMLFCRIVNAFDAKDNRWRAELRNIMDTLWAEGWFHPLARA